MPPLRSPALLSVAALLVALWPPDHALAWTDATRVRMLRDALRVSPPALRTLLERHDRDLRRGMLDPSRHETEEVHFQEPGGRGLGATAVSRKAAAVRDLLAQGGSLKRVAYEMGVLAHLVSDVAFPLNASEADPREPRYREAYRAYVETNLGKFPFVFDREGEAVLARGDLRAFMMGRAGRAAKDYALIGPAYNDDGTPRSGAALDERSVPFGVAALSYARATSDVALIWRHLWASVNGDMTGTPFAGPEAPQKVTLPPRAARSAKGKPKAPAPPGPDAPPRPAGEPATAPTPSPSGTPAPAAAPSPSGTPAPPAAPTGGRPETAP